MPGTDLAVVLPIGAPATDGPDTDAPDDGITVVSTRGPVSTPISTPVASYVNPVARVSPPPSTPLPSRAALVVVAMPVLWVLLVLQAPEGPWRGGALIAGWVVMGVLFERLGSRGRRTRGIE